MGSTRLPPPALACLAVCGTLAAPPGYAQAPPSPRDLTELTPAELAKLEVTSVSRKGQRLAEAAAAVFVITQEDLRRSGATTLAEALRMVPGLNVARVNSNQWAISARGFNGRFANKLLVLIDGRTVYTPLFSGVYWEVQDTFLDDVERIEVIRGAGASLWGANAVDGVINIITRPAGDTQGGLLVGAAGSLEHGLAGLRWGGRLGERGHFRVFGKYFDRDAFALEADEEGFDGWDMFRGGGRAEWQLADGNALTLLGELYDGDAGDRYAIAALAPPFQQLVGGDAQLSGGHLLGRWEKGFSERSDLAVTVYYDRARRDDAVHREVRDTWELDFQHRFSTGRHELVWGLGYRVSADDILGGPLGRMVPAERTDELFSAFAQDEIALADDRLRLTLGSKLEHNDYTGWEVQPTLRLLWGAGRPHTVWAAVSRAVRTPARFEHTIEAALEVMPTPGGLANAGVLLGDAGFGSEKLVAYEAGWRHQPSQRFTLDLTAFVNDYRSLETFEPGLPTLRPGPPFPHLVTPLSPRNLKRGEAWGAELAAQWEVSPRLRLGLAYSALRLELELEPGSNDVIGVGGEGDVPENQLHLRSSLDLPGELGLDASLSWTDGLPNQEVDGYARLDARLGWRPLPELEVALVGRNLLEARHAEFGASFLTTPTLVERDVYVRVAWRF